MATSSVAVVEATVSSLYPFPRLIWFYIPMGVEAHIEIYMTQRTQYHSTQEYQTHLREHASTSNIKEHSD